MQFNSRYESTLNREEALSHPVSSGYRQAQGYITLSPARKIKDRNKSQRNSQPYELDQERGGSVSMSQHHPNYLLMKQNQNSDNLPIRTEQYFKKIPKYSLHQVTIRQAFCEGPSESHSNKKKKLSVTKLFQNIDLSNRSQDGGSLYPSYKLRDFEADK